MPAAVKTTVTELEGSRVRLTVEVPAAEVDGRVERKANELGRELKLPGFRRGKVPPGLVIQRIGREAVVEQAVREELPRWYSDAIGAAGVVPIGDPNVQLDDLPAAGQPLEFAIEVGVLPKAVLGEYKGLEVPRREADVTQERIDAEVEAVRDRLARLQSVDRAAEQGDFVVVDYAGRKRDGGGSAHGGEQGNAAGEPIAGAEGRDQLLELGAGRLIPGFEEGLVGARAGESKQLDLEFPDDYPAEALAGAEVTFEVTVKDVKRKDLPALDDDLAIDAGFDSLAELREDISKAVAEAEERVIEAEYREAALDAAAAGARVELTHELVQARAHEMWERMLHSLAHRGVSREAYLKVSSRDEPQILAELEPDAEKALRREAVLSAIVAAEGISPSEEELLEALGGAVDGDGAAPDEVLERLRSSGRLEEVREDLAARQAVDLIAAQARPISVAQADARDRLWTPERAEQERDASDGGGARASSTRLWTPTDRGAAS